MCALSFLRARYQLEILISRDAISVFLYFLQVKSVKFHVYAYGTFIALLRHSN